MPIRRHSLAFALILLGVTLLALPIRLMAQTAEPLPTPTLAAPPPAAPTGTDPSAPLIPQVHTVQDGENMTIIAAQYGVTVEDILAVNNLANGDLLQVGQELIIPGGTGEAVATSYTIVPGDTVAAVAALFNTTLAEIIATNRLIIANPPLLSGQAIPVISRTGSAAAQPVTGLPYLVAPGDTLLLVALSHNITPAELAQANGLTVDSRIFPDQRLRIPDGSAVYHDLPEGWLDLRVNQPSLAQGSTLSIFVRNMLPGTPAGRFGDIPLHFAPFEDGYLALVGIDAFTEPGVYELELSGGDERDLWQPLRALMTVADGGYGTQYIEIGDELSGLLDPAVRAADDAFLEGIYAVFSGEKHWSDVFQAPLTTTIISADYGGRRSYNGGPIEIYHTGIDYASATGTDVLAPAAGVVVFDDVTELRGNVIIIDHGLGVMTGYYHLSESLVDVGQVVATGEVIGRVGSTGLSSGSHLHWDLRIMNVPVNPAMWLQAAIPGPR